MTETIKSLPGTSRAQTKLVGTAYVKGKPHRQEFQPGERLLLVQAWASGIKGAVALKVEGPPYDLTNVRYYERNLTTGKWNRCNLKTVYRRIKRDEQDQIPYGPDHKRELQ